MNNHEFEKSMAYLCIALFAILVFGFVVRCIRILVTKKVDTADDFIAVIAMGLIAVPFMYAYEKLKQKFKK